MKKILILTGIILASLLSCNEDDYEAPYGDYSSFNWLTTENSEETDYVIPINGFIGFYDLSNNPLSNSWEIPEGTSFLNNKFTSGANGYSEFITSNGPSSSSQKQANILFTTPGIKEIVLNSTFKDSVTDGVFLDGVWKVEKKFTVDVFADINPAFKVLKGGVEILSITENDMPLAGNSASWPTVSIEAGEELTFVDLTTVGRPDTRTWTFNGGNKASTNTETAVVGYFALGTFKAGSLTVKRNNSATKPAGETVKLIPLNIQVVPSSQPFVQVGQINENASEVISFKVSGQVQTLSGQEGNFAVHVTNATAGFDKNIAVVSAKINSSDLTQIDLTLGEPIFNSDIVTVQYTAGNIVSVDTRVLESFGPVNVGMHFEGAMNVAGFTGYEQEWGGSGNQFRKANTEGYFAQHNGTSEAGPLYYWRDTSFKKEGNSSMKFETDASGIPSLARLQGSSFSSLSPVTAGSYIPAVWIYLDSGNTMSSIQYNFTTDASFVFDISTTTRGQWVRLKLPVVTLPDINSGRLDLNISNSGQADARVQKLWLDSFDLLIIETR
ncbi:hypothetical protein [Mariniflexile sp. AS56]|uniref:hypothetical protein n=1 Tax=Mariniflexile sp. AS56 TaxID=3063957 RepID=UPI0026F1767D|nr:hypothetical protein [Mariniflexile sp. AS56]MDO7173171.1 hypothetical protein [Mariniflexile sp. AS56]